MRKYLMMLFAAALAGCAGSDDAALEPLVKVGRETITRQDFADFWETLDPASKSKGREWLLENLITRQILVQEALARGLDTSETVRRELRRAVDRKLTDELFERQVASRVEVSEAEFADLRDYMIRHGLSGLTEMRIGHIPAATLEEARRVIGEYREGADFAGLARRYSADPDLAERGGDLGYWPDGRSGGSPAEVAAALETGDISEPVVDEEGVHHLVAVLDRRPLEFLDLAALHSQMENRIRATKTRQARERYMEYLVERYRLELDHQNLALLLQRGWRCIDGIPLLEPSDKDRVLLNYRGGQVLLREYTGWLEEIRPAQRRPSPVDSAQVAYFATRRAITDRLYPAEARAQGLEDEPAARRYAERKRADLMIGEFRRAFEAPLLNESEVATYYQANPDRFRQPERVFAEALLVMAEETARQVLAEARNQGLSTFPAGQEKETTHLVFSCSVDEVGAGAGGSLCAAAVEAEIGVWIGPLKLQPRNRREVVRYAVLHVLDRYPEQTPDLSDPGVREEAEKALRQERREALEKAFDAYLADLYEAWQDQVERYPVQWPDG